ncbi:MAG TPA: hypothetical protein VKF37_13665 [Chloroflexota bacterium]|nr:hypothetical protein [Chloroflexota bacterium]
MLISDSFWIDDLREELRRRQNRGDLVGRMRYALTGEGDVSRAQAGAADEAVARAETLVRTLLDQMNQMLLGGRGSVWDTPAAWGVHLWELWWEPTRERGPYLVVTLLRDSRGTPYLKVQGRRLALEDTRLARRLQRALRAAFLEPRVYTPRVRVPTGAQDLLRPTLPGIGRGGGGLPNIMPDVPPTHVGAETNGPAAETWGRTMRARRRGRRTERDDA